MTQLLGVVLILVAAFIASVWSYAIGNRQHEGLYKPSDRVAILNFENFNETVYNSDKAWLIEFYASWCGHCQHFAPKMKSFAKEVYDWRDVVSVGVVECGSDENYDLCDRLEIFGFPQIKFFPVQSSTDFVGDAFTHQQMNMDLKHVLIDKLEEQQLVEKGSPTWPTILPVKTKEVEAMLIDLPKNIEHLILIIEEPKSVLGAEIILDLRKLKDVQIRRMYATNETLAEYADEIPTIIVYDRNNDNEEYTLPIETPSKEDIESAILNYLNKSNVSTTIDYETQTTTTVLNGVLTEQDHNDEKQTSSENSALEQNSVLEEDDELHQTDLESTLEYMLNSEIPRARIIDGEKLEALKYFLSVLTKYFPGSFLDTARYLQDLKSTVEGKSRITGSDFKKLAKDKADSRVIYLNQVADIAEWKVCAGSKSKYSCGLWTLFHTVTVRQSKYNYDEDRSVLNAIHGYVKHFFGCTECSLHFQKMFDERNGSAVPVGAKTVRWLWRAHNEVNARLANRTELENSQRPKVQYPSREQCDRCRNEFGEWDDNEVLAYLGNKYSDSKENRDLAYSKTSYGLDHYNIVALYVFIIFILIISYALFAQNVNKRQYHLGKR